MDETNQTVVVESVSRKLSVIECAEDQALVAAIVRGIEFQAPPDDPLARTVKGPCWTWTRRRSHKGYALVRGKVSWRFVHRVTARLAGLEIDEKHIDHLCRNRACVNPDHLEPVTPQENTRRGNLARSINAKACNKCGSTDGEVVVRGAHRKWKCRDCLRAAARVHNANRRSRGPAYQAELNARNRAAKVHGTSVRWREFISDHERHLFA